MTGRVRRELLHHRLLQGSCSEHRIALSEQNLHFLEAVAERYKLDAGGLIATAKAALAAPDRAVEISDRVVT